MDKTETHMEEYHRYGPNLATTNKEQLTLMRERRAPDMWLYRRCSRVGARCYR